MTQPKNPPAKDIVRRIAPKFAQLGNEILYGDIWERPELSKRDRSLITCAALVALGRTEQMATHFPLAIENGVSQAEIVEMITHMAFYAGWPAASSAAVRASEIFGAELDD
ncbi:carboxymuconolactone decarboxylase family protein [Sphingobium sp. EP60837]|uniref:carboxymuconolactone decarboxylase family protein n=1 Tax=Sphingobium sp. EP60837 TaxID=1855519 RepID=UPI0007DD6921|nr:carboxymuconolactone decarboxylase family protein [Sphingobium sp. EP60837]ANI80150.1 4-carboxymuconolactone decarboxylase [Sphingobium sp. EP60837]